ncbi:MAG: helix-turn-helix transcriptional regulator [Bacilli bacterium]|nr:helix-turn-helix transcriptional regulator [Bacilli bacterium]
MFGERLKLVLENRNISQIRLAQELGLTPPAINRWCNNVTEPDNKTIVKIANILNVSTDYLLGNDLNFDSELEKELKEKETLKKALKSVGYMNDNEDLKDEELDRLMKFVVNNKDFLKENNRG